MDELFPTLTPSEIFLRLWRFRCRADSEETPEDFRLCADAYAWISAREAEEAEKIAVPQRDGEGAVPYKVHRVKPEDIGRLQGLGIDWSAVAESARAEYAAKAPQPEIKPVTVTAGDIAEAAGDFDAVDAAIAAAAKAQQKPAPAAEAQQEQPKPKAKVTDLAKKKTRIRAELESRRETGTGLQDVVDASRGRVTMAMLLDALDAMPLTVAQWEDIGRAIKAAKIKKTWADKEAAPE